jgi:phosphonate transport system substrate-binding protein
MIKQTLLALVLATLLLSSMPAYAQTLTFGVHPFLSSIELNKRFQPLVDYLSQQTGNVIKFQVMNSYASLIDGVCCHNIDLAFTGPNEYVQMTKCNCRIQLLGMLVGDYPHLRGALVVRQDSDIKHLEQLRGKRIAFVQPKSTMGSQLPLALLQQHGVLLADLQHYDFLGNHENVAYAVLTGQYDAGALKHEVAEKMRPLGLRVLADLPEVADHPFVAGPQVAAASVAQIKDLLLNLHTNSAGRAILTGLRPDAVQIVPITDSDYDSLRNYAPVTTTSDGARM